MRAVLLALWLVACGSSPAGEGETCVRSNSLDECDDGLVCTREQAQTVCRVLCDDASVRCPTGTICSSIPGGPHRSCQPAIR